MKYHISILMMALVLLCMQTASASDINVTDADVVINITPSIPPDDALDSSDAAPHEKFNDVLVYLADVTLNITPCTPPDDALDSSDAAPHEKFNDISVHLADVTLNFTPCTPPPDALDSSDAAPHEKFNDISVYLADVTLNITPCTPPDDALDSSDAAPHEKFNDVSVHLADVALNITPCTPPDDALDSSDATPHEEFNDVSVHLADVTLNITPCTPPPDALDSSDAAPHEKFNDVFVHLADVTLNFTPCTPPPDALDSSDAAPHEKFNDVSVHLADVTLNFTPSTPPVDALDSAEAPPQEIIYNLKPDDNTITGSTDVLITWRTAANSTTDAFVKKKEEAEWTYISGESGINHVVLLSNLTRNTWYEFYVMSNSTRASSVSGVRSLYIDNGIVFMNRNYSSTVERDYDQRIKVSIKNTDSKVHTVLVSVINPYEDIIAGFVGEGSQDQIISLAPSEVKEVTLAIHAQDADEEDYVLLLNLTNIGEEIKDYACFNLHVRQPIINFVLEEVSTDQYTLTKKLRLRNLGDTITDFKVYVSEGFEDKVILQPNIEHMRLTSGGATLFDASPLLHENFTGISGKIIATGAGANVSLNVSFIPPEGKSVFSGNVGGALCNFTRETPRNTSIWAEQISEGVASVGIAAQFNYTRCAFVIDNITRAGNLFIIEVDSLVDVSSEMNLTTIHEWLTFTNLSRGNYIVKVTDRELGELANQSLEMEPFGMFLEEDNLTGKLYTFVGNISNISSLVPLPLVSPPKFFNETAFWINSTDELILSVELNNTGSQTYEIDFVLNSQSLNISPNNYSISLGNNSSEVLFFVVSTQSLPWGVYNSTYILNYSITNSNTTLFGSIPVGVYEVNYTWEGDVLIIRITSPFNDTFIERAWNFANVSYGYFPQNTSGEIIFSNATKLKYPRTDVILICSAISKMTVVKYVQKHIEHRSEIDYTIVGVKAWEGYLYGSSISSFHSATIANFGEEMWLSNMRMYYGMFKIWGRGVKLIGRAVEIFSWLTKAISAAQLFLTNLFGGTIDYAPGLIADLASLPDYFTTNIIANEIKEFPSHTHSILLANMPDYDHDGDGVSTPEEMRLGYDAWDSESCPGVEASTRNGDWYCNNRPSINIPFDTQIPAPDQINDPVDPYLIVRFIPSSYGSGVKPHNVYVLFNGQEIGRLTNTIPEGYYMFYVDPALLNVELDVTRNVVSLITTHHNPGHYIVSTGMRLVFVFDDIDINVFASDQDEANQIVADKYKAATRKPDFGVCAETVSLANQPFVGTETAINVKLYNLGTIGMRDVLMQAFDNDVLIEEKVIPFVYLMSSQNVSFSWVPSSSGKHVIKVKVNSEQSINESDYTNNEAAKEVNVAAGDAKPPVISEPTPANWSKTSDSRPKVSAKFSDDYSGINILSAKLFVDSIDVTDAANVSATEISYIPAEDLDDGLHNVTVAVEDNTGKASSLLWVFIVDMNPPTSISNLSAVDIGARWILWNWNNPTDDDFDHVEMWINNTWRENVTYLWHVYNATGLNPNTTYKISARAVDDVGNINETWINESAKTLPLEEDNVPPVISNITAANIAINSATITWGTDEPSDSLVKYGTESGNYTLQKYASENVTSHSIHLIGVLPNTTYYFVVNSTDQSGNSAESTEYSFTTKTPSALVFDTGSPENPYPSIMGNHTGTITPNHTVIATKLYIYPCAGTGGHTKYAKIGNKTWNTTATWNGYAGDWHNIAFDKTVVLLANETYNYTIRTGSYPQIHHNRTLLTASGWINCTEFTDANGKKHTNWIPAVRLWS